MLQITSRGVENSSYAIRATNTTLNFPQNLAMDQTHPMNSIFLSYNK